MQTTGAKQPQDRGRFEALARRLEEAVGGDRVVLGLSLDRWCTYQVGGKAPLAVFPRTGEELAEVARILGDAPFQVLGLGSNVLVSDEGLDEPVVITKDLSGMGLDVDGLVWSDAGASCTDLAALALDAGLSGLEFFHMLPGSVGGAAYMNARAFGQEVSQRLVRARLVTRQGDMLSLELSKDDFSYKQSPFMGHDWIIERLWWRLSPADPGEIQSRMAANEEHRRRNGELDHPSCGCVFKNPSGRSAGRMIESCGLKGFRVGGAWVSEQHANFVVHDGKATARDIRAVAEEVRRVVRDRTQVDLEYEVRFLGRWSEPKSR